MRVLLFTFLVVAALPAAPGQAPGAANAQQPVTIRTGAQEVLLDVIVRDRKGRAVRDLSPRDIEVFDAGAPVQIRSFRFVERESGEAAPGPEKRATASRAVAPAPALDPLRQIRLVSLVFERLSVDGRRLFKQSALDLIEAAHERNIYFAIFYVDQRLHVLQQFTNDRGALKKAVDRAISGSYSQYVSQSGEVQKELENTSSLEQAADAAAANAQTAGSAAVGEAQAAATLARMQLNMLQFSQSNQALQQARGSIFSLLGLVKEQVRLPGRKMLLYFSEDFRVPGDIQEHFRTLISAANRANVSIYTVDARGLVTSSQNDEGRALLSAAAKSSESEAGRYRRGVPKPVTPDEVRVFDTVLDGLRANIQESLAELATSTGGFLIADSNDLRTPLRKALEEIRSYYEIAYTPGIVNYDGHFRSIEVRARRPDVTIQARSGYYALPPLNEAPLFPFEMPLLNALTRTPLPRAFEYRAGVQRFDPRGREIEYAVTVEVPLKGLTFVADKEKKIYQVRASLLIFFKNEQGAIVAKMSRDFPYEAPLDRMDAFRNGNLIQTYHVKLPPGRYTLETAVADRNAEAVSARKSALLVPPPARGLAISEMVLIRRVEPQTEESDPADPYHFEGGKVVPTLSDTFEGVRAIPLYFSIYPESGNPASPELTIGLLKDGKVLGRSSPALPKPDKAGRIAYVATLPLENITDGQYEVRAIVKQGSATAAEHAYFTLKQ